MNESEKHLPQRKEPIDINVVKKSYAPLTKYTPEDGLSVFETTSALPTPEELLAEWLAGKSENTRKSYESDAKLFANWANEPSASAVLARLIESGPEISTRIVAQYKKWLDQESKKAPNTINRRLSSIRQLLRAAKAATLIDWDIVVPNEKPQLVRDTRSPGLGKVIDMLQYLFNEGESGKLSGYRDFTALTLMMTEGFRRMEVYGMRVLDWLPEDSGCMVKQKGQKHRALLEIQPKGANAIQQWLESRDDTPGALFCSFAKGHEYKEMDPSSVNRIYKRVGKALGIKQCNPHAIGRHTFGTEAAKHLDALDLMKAMRHKNLNTSQQYIDGLREGRWDVVKQLTQEMDLPSFQMKAPDKSQPTTKSQPENSEDLYY